ASPVTGPGAPPRHHRLASGFPLPARRGSLHARGGRLDDVGGAAVPRLAVAAGGGLDQCEPVPVPARRQPRAHAVAVAGGCALHRPAGDRVAALNSLGCVEEAGPRIIRSPAAFGETSATRHRRNPGTTSCAGRTG